MPINYIKSILVFDDREFTSGEVKGIVGLRHYGEIIYKRRSLYEHFYSSLPMWAKNNLIHLKNNLDLVKLRNTIESSSSDSTVCVIAARAGFSNFNLLSQFIERLPYADENFTDKLYKPLITNFKNAHNLLNNWHDFTSVPIHNWTRSWEQSKRLQSLKPEDLGEIRSLLKYISASTATRHFNNLQMDDYYLKKSSTDKIKMKAEYLFYELAPKHMRPWFVEPFDFEEEENIASYKMLRYHLADAALQWVHGAFNADTFRSFIDRLFFFISERSKIDCNPEQSKSISQSLFVNKVKRRVQEFLTSREGQKINRLVSNVTEDLDVTYLLNRYLKLYKRFEINFSLNYQVVGHGDPCFSNILYDQQKYILKLIDPKGSLTMEELWTHPFYDLCKISHSILGDYDFINNGLYKLEFNEVNEFFLNFDYTNQHRSLKEIYVDYLNEERYNIRILRLGDRLWMLCVLECWFASLY